VAVALPSLQRRLEGIAVLHLARKIIVGVRDGASTWLLITNANLDRLALESSRATSVTLNPGTRLGAYEITSLIGVGGTGEEYRARGGR